MNASLFAASLLAVALPVAAAPQKPSASLQKCLENSSIEDSVRRYYADGQHARRDPENRFSDYLVFHSQCQALSGQGEKACDAIKLSANGPEGDLPSKCRQQTREAEFIKAIVTGDPNKESKCSLQMKMLKWEFKPGVAEPQLCKIFLDSWDRPDQLTARVSKLLVKPIEGKEQWDIFVARKAGTMGLEKYCMLQPAFDEQQICAEYAAFRKAAAAKNADACGDRGICRQLVKSEPKACGVYEKRLREIACRPAEKSDLAAQ